jgi:hypothetical protein
LSLTLRKEQRLRAFENMLLRKMFGPYKDEVTGGCRKLHNEELHDFLRFEVFTAVTMKNGVFWDVTPCGFCKNERFGGT